MSESENDRRLDPLVLRAGWEFIERGWWTHDLLGGVVSEGKRWGCYPLDLKDDAPAHSEPTRVAAMKWVEDRYTQNEKEGESLRREREHLDKGGASSSLVVGDSGGGQ